MENQEIYNALIEHISKENIFINEPMKKHTTFKVGGNADFYIKVHTIDELLFVLKQSQSFNKPITIIGNGSNVLVKDNGIRGIVIETSMDNIKIEESDFGVYVTAEAGAKLATVAYKLLQEGITGFEFAAGIPGTIGGAVKMNAGAYQNEMKDVVYETTSVDYDGNIYKMDNAQQMFKYRSSIYAKNKHVIISTVLNLKHGNKEEIQKKMEEYAKYRKEKQPIQYPSAGSTFKRGEDFITAKLIDECGLKGYTIGDAQVSLIHSGFIINKGNATASDIIELAEFIKKKVYEKFKKSIDLEIEILGE